jgi:hypothetical protein
MDLIGRRSKQRDRREMEMKVIYSKKPPTLSSASGTSNPHWMHGGEKKNSSKRGSDPSKKRVTIKKALEIARRGDAR